MKEIGPHHFLVMHVYVRHLIDNKKDKETEGYKVLTEIRIHPVDVIVLIDYFSVSRLNSIECADIAVCVLSRYHFLFFIHKFT